MYEFFIRNFTVFMMQFDNLAPHFNTPLPNNSPISYVFILDVSVLVQKTRVFNGKYWRFSTKVNKLKLLIRLVSSVVYFLPTL